LHGRLRRPTKTPNQLMLQLKVPKVSLAVRTGGCARLGQ
jgi:hypothetical protein